MTDAGENRREQMLRAALEVIVERGYADTRIADVAERTGTSPALVIYYFKTRDQLLTEAIRYSEDSWYAEGQRRIDRKSTRLNSSHLGISYAVFCLKKKKTHNSSLSSQQSLSGTNAILT